MMYGPPYVIDGYPAATDQSSEVDEQLDVTTAEYAANQEYVNSAKTADYLFPLLQAASASSVLDVGCGTGSMVAWLREAGLEAFGVDLPPLRKHWARLQRSPEWFHIVGADELRLLFNDNELDFAFTFGVIEHIGTTNGHSDRRPDYHDIRKQWLNEVFRVVKPGGQILIGGPNRAFPVDTAHGPDTQASRFEMWFWQRTGITLHRVWGENFLWGYSDISRYLKGQQYEVKPLSVAGFLRLSRVPAPLRMLTSWYLRLLPDALLGSALNPYVMALITKSRVDETQ